MSEFSRETLLNIIETDHVQCGEASALACMALAAMDSESGCLPLDYLQGHKDGLEWAAQLAEANHHETGDWLYDDPIELAKAIRKGPDMPPAQPVADSEPDRNPVLAYADSYRDMAKQGVESVPIWSVITDLERNIAPLYRHAQPAPVVPVLTRADFENWCQKTFALSPSYFEKDANGVYMSTLVHDLYVAWEGCRAAMLNPDKARKKVRVLVLGASIGAGFDATASGNSPAQSDCCPTQNHVSPEQNSVAPAQRHGWIPVSERMPENDGAYLCWDNRYVTTYAFIFGAWQANQFIAKNITHWMPLPAGPQEVR